MPLGGLVPEPPEPPLPAPPDPDPSGGVHDPFFSKIEPTVKAKHIKSMLIFKVRNQTFFLLYINLKLNFLFVTEATQFCVTAGSTLI